MTIASAFNDIAVANGGTADNSGTIAGAVDALTDALAGSDVAQGATIEDGVRVLGEYISGGGGGGTVDVYTNFDGIDWPAPTIDGVAVQLEPVTGKEGLYKFSAEVGAIPATSANRSEAGLAYGVYNSLNDIGVNAAIVSFGGGFKPSGNTYFPPISDKVTFIGFED